MARSNVKKVYASDEKILYFEPRNENQALAIDIIKNHDITFLTGPAGCGKTQCAIYSALVDLEIGSANRRKQRQRLVITRPVIEAGEHLGHLPGEIKEKVHPYMLPIYDCVAKMVNDGSKFINDNVQIAPLAYMRGATYEHCVAVLDEAQNCTIGQIKLFLTRLGMNGKMIITGDTDQSDIGRGSGLKPWIDALKGVPGIGFMAFTEDDIVRHPLVRTILKKQPKTK